MPKPVKQDPVYEYCLDDVLEMKYSPNRGKLTEVKKQLLSSREKIKSFDPLFTFGLGKHLVAIHENPRACFKKLFLLNARKQSFEVIELERKG